MGKRTGWVALGVMIAAALLVPGCGRRRVAVRAGTPPPVVVQPPPVVAPIPPPGPPAHAPAHGYRAKHVYQYYYYPSAYVYYCPQRGLYWYLRGDRWEVGVSLPDSVSVTVGDHVSLKTESDLPYVDFEAHKHAYPPGGKHKGQPQKGKGKQKRR